VVSLLAVTHQGPAQGGKAGDSKLPENESIKDAQTLQAALPIDHNPDTAESHAALLTNADAMPSFWNQAQFSL
jgi:hypothetical protein